VLSRKIYLPALRQWQREQRQQQREAAAAAAAGSGGGAPPPSGGGTPHAQQLEDGDSGSAPPPPGAEGLPVIVSVDLQPMAPIEGVVQLQGDITSEATAAQVGGRLEGARRWGGDTRLRLCSGPPVRARANLTPPPPTPPPQHPLLPR
jgi:hypothetical protein